MRNNKHRNSKFKSKKGPGGTPLPSTGSKTVGRNEKLAPTFKGPGVDGVKAPTKVKESFQEIKKITSDNINTFNMSKSLFDKLFEDVMSGGAEDVETPDGGDEYSDERELGIDEGDFGGEEGGEDEVTFTLDRATAQKLHEVLAAVLGGGEEELGGEEDFGSEEEDLDLEDGGEEEEEEGANPFGEGAEIEELKGAEGKLKQLQGKGNMKVKTSSQFAPKGGKANLGKVPAQEPGKALANKGESLKKHASMKVSGVEYGAFQG